MEVDFDCRLHPVNPHSNNLKIIQVCQRSEKTIQVTKMKYIRNL